MKRYDVMFIVKKNRTMYSHSVPVMANNAKEAREKVENAWYADHSEHLFRVTVRLSKGVIA